MPKFACLVLVILSAGPASAASAQHTELVSVGSADTLQIAPPGLSRQAINTHRSLKDACTAELSGGELSGAALDTAISACVAGRGPDVAQRERCRTRGFDQGLRSEGLRIFIGDCLRSRS